MHFSQKSFSHAGVSITFFEAGEGETLIFIPGWGARPFTYRRILELLAKKYHVISPELPGFNSSSAPKKAWNFTDYAAFYSAFIDSLPQEKVILTGHSIGGGIALHTALSSNQISQLILFDAFGIPLSHSRLKLSLLYSLQLLGESLIPTNWIEAMNNTYQFLLNISHLRYITAFTLAFFNNQNYDATIFKQIAIPVAFIWGDRDTIFGKDTATKLHGLLPQARLAYVTGTHNWVIFHPELLSSVL